MLRSSFEPGFKTRLLGAVLSTELPTVDHHDSIKLSVRWCVCGRSGKDFPVGSHPRH